MGEFYSNPVSGGVIAAGRQYVPSWLRSLPVGQWSSAIGSALGSSSAVYSEAGWGSVQGVVDGWGGWAVDYAARKIYLQGGGHSDYGGNEIYCCDLNTLVWTRLTNPTLAAQATRFINGSVHSKWNSDGTPVASHVYWNAHVIGGTILRAPYFNDFGQTLAGAHTFAPNNEARLHGFNIATGQWDSPTARALFPNFTAADPTSGGVGPGACCSDGEFYYAMLYGYSDGKTLLRKYSPSSNSWTPIGSSDLGPYAGDVDVGNPGSIYDSLRHEMVRVCHGSTPIKRFDLTTGGVTNTTKTGIPFGAGWDSSYTGCCYDSRRDKYYLYSGKTTTDKSLYVCDPANGYEMSIMSGTGAPSPVTPVSGINSRFKYFAGWDCIVMQPTFSDPLQVLRLS